MKTFIQLFLIGYLALSAADSPYSEKEPSRDGIGKVYMGREISFVLGHRGIQWLERDERAKEEQPDRLVELLKLAPKTTIADIGAGSGYITFRLQQALPQGNVVAVDIQQEMLDAIERKIEAGGVSNVSTVLGSITDVGLEAESVDAVIMVDAYHEFSHPKEMAGSILRALRPGGAVYLIEYRAEDPDVPMLPLHKMTEKQARLEWEAAGFLFEENRKGLPWQHILIFKKPQ